MTGTLQSIQLEQALYEVKRGLVGNERLVDRLFVATLAARPVIVSGPHGVGKQHAAEALARVFGMATTVTHVAESDPGDAHYDAAVVEIVAGIEAAPDYMLGGLADRLSRPQPSNTVLTAAVADPAVLPRRLRDHTMMYVAADYPERCDEIALAAGWTSSIDTILRPSDLDHLRSMASRLLAPDAVLRYAVTIVQATRNPTAAGLANLAPLIGEAASPRASVSLVTAARAAAFIAGRREVTFQDVFDVAYDVLIHRVEPSRLAREQGVGAADIVVELLSRLPAGSIV